MTWIINDVILKASIVSRCQKLNGSLSDKYSSGESHNAGTSIELTDILRTDSLKIGDTAKHQCFAILCGKSFSSAMGRLVFVGQQAENCLTDRNQIWLKGWSSLHLGRVHKFIVDVSGVSSVQYGEVAAFAFLIPDSSSFPKYLAHPEDVASADLHDCGFNDSI